MHTLQLSFPPVPALQHLPGEGRLHFTPQVTSQLWDRLVQALELLYVKDAPSSSSSGHAAAAQHTAAGACKRRAQDAAEAAPPAASPKRTRGAAQQLPEISLVKHLQGNKQQQDTFSITIADELENRVQFRVSPLTTVGTVLEAFAEFMGLDVEKDGLKFILDGERASPKLTLEEIQMGDGEIAVCFKRQCGC
jgi:hypothetical protein